MSGFCVHYSFRTLFLWSSLCWCGWKWFYFVEIYPQTSTTRRIYIIRFTHTHTKINKLAFLFVYARRQVHQSACYISATIIIYSPHFYGALRVLNFPSPRLLFSFESSRFYVCTRPRYPGYPIFVVNPRLHFLSPKVHPNCAAPPLNGGSRSSSHPPKIQSLIWDLSTSIC